MFKRRRDALARQVEGEVEFWDFFDVAGLWERQEKVAGTGMAMTVVGVLGGRAIGGVGWIDGVFGAARVMGSNNLRKMIIPGVVAAAVLISTYLLASIPTSLPPRLSRKLAHNLYQLDYVHSNATRITAETRKVLRFPAANLNVALQRNVEGLEKKKEEVKKVETESQGARKFFGSLVRDAQEGRRSVESVDLEGPAPGVAATHER